MTADKTYKNWKAVTEADFVSLFIKTWFAYISTLRIMYPEAYNRRGDKKYLNKYKDFYRTEGYRRFNVDKNVMASIEKVYQEGRNVIQNIIFGIFIKLTMILNLAIDKCRQTGLSVSL